MKPLTFVLVVFAIVGLTIMPVWILAICLKMNLSTYDIIYVEGAAIAFSVGVIYMLVKSYLTFND